MDRRSFLQATSAIAGAAVAGNQVTAGQFTGKITKAVKYHMVTGKQSVEDKFRMVKDLGFDGVEVYTRDAADRAAYRKAREVTGLPIHGVINSSDPDMRIVEGKVLWDLGTLAPHESRTISISAVAADMGSIRMAVFAGKVPFHSRNGNTASGNHVIAGLMAVLTPEIQSAIRSPHVHVMIFGRIGQF